MAKTTPLANWKTTAAAVVGGVMLIVNQVVPEAVPYIKDVAGVLGAVAIAMGFHVAKDADG